MGVETIIDMFEKESFIGAFIFQDNGKIVFANDRIAEIFGFNRREELVGRSFFDFLASQREEIISSANKRVKEGISLKEYGRVKILSRDNSILYVDAFAYTINYEGENAGLVLVIDRTKEECLKRLFYALSEVNQMIIREDGEKLLLKKVCDVLVENVGFFSAGVGRVDEATRLFRLDYVRSVSDKAEKFYKEKEILISVDPSVEYGKGSVYRAYSKREVACVSDVQNNEDLSYWRKYYKMFNIYYTCSIPIIENDAVKYILIINDNVRNNLVEPYLRLLNELKLDLSFALEKIDKDRRLSLFNEAVDRAHEWALVTDKDGRIVYVNDLVTSLSGYSKEEILGNNPNIFKSGYHDKKFYENLWETIKKGDIWRGIITNRKKNGDLFYLDSVIVPVFQNGKISNFVDLSRDISEEVKLKEKLKFHTHIYETLYEITNLALGSVTEEEFLDEIVEIFVKSGGFDAAIVVDRDLKLKSHFTVEELKNLPDRLSSVFNDLISKNRLNEIPAYRTLLKNKVFVRNDMKLLKSEPLRRFTEEFGIKSGCSLPIVKKGDVVASLILMSKVDHLFDKKLFELVVTVTKQIEYTFSKIEMEKFYGMIQQALNSSFEVVVITDSDFNIVYVNDAMERISKYRKEEVIGKHHSIFSSGKYPKEFVYNFYKTLKSGKVFSNVMTYRAKDGSLFSFYMTIYPYKVNGKITNYIAIGKEITKDDNVVREIKRLLYTDSLTGLLNASSFLEAIDRFIVRAEREGLMGAVVVINPISFKRVNEAFGYEIGNELIKSISDRLRKIVFEYDVLAKLESDRFGVLLKDIKREENILIAVSKILSEIKKPYNVKGKSITLLFSIGISTYPKDGVTARDLLSKAHIGLADARTKGENQIGFFKKDFEEKALKFIELRTRLENAVKNKEFYPYFQPYVDGNGKIVGAESLMRWIKDGNIIPPMEFITYLEKTDLIKFAESRILDVVLSVIHENGLPISVSVNLSERSLNRPNLYSYVMRKIAKKGVLPHLIKLEIVERSFMGNFPKLKSLINKFREKNIGFLIDDFGTGYSSLSYLSELSVESVKIDISFVRRIESSKHARNIVESIIFLSQKLGMKTVAEGVETEEQFRILKDMGCNYFQGYLFFKPMPQEEFVKAVKSHSGSII